MADARPTARDRMSPAIRFALEAAARRGVETAALALGIAPQGQRTKLVKGAKPREDEFEMQCELFARIDASPHLSELPIYAVPNFFGHYGTPKQRQLAGAKAQRSGRRKGVPDICIDVARGQWHGLRIEMKTPTGSTKPEQKAWHERMRRHGYRVEVCRSVQDALALLDAYLALPSHPAQR